MKTANQLYKESGSTLTFKEWLNEKKLNADGSPSTNIIIDKTLNDSVQSAINEGKQVTGFKTTTTNKTVFGIPNYAFYIVGGVVVIWAGYGIYKAVNKKQ